MSNIIINISVPEHQQTNKFVAKELSELAQERRKKKMFEGKSAFEDPKPLKALTYVRNIHKKNQQEGRTR